VRAIAVRATALAVALAIAYAFDMFVSRVNKQSPDRRAAAGWDDLRAHNTALLLRSAWRAQRTSRAELARMTGLSRATVSDIVAGFLDAGLLGETEEASPRTASGGRPPTILRFNDDGRHILGVELGATHIAAVRVDLRGRVCARAAVDVDVAGDPPGTLDALVAVALRLRDAAPVPVIGVGLALPPPLRAGGAAQLSPRLFPRWSGIAVAAPLGAALGVPVVADNDANLGALAEHWWGAGRGVADLAYIKVATGVGAGILIGGEIHRGAAGIAGEIGHTSIDPSGALCRCGLTGCLEAFVGTSYLLARAELADGGWGGEARTVTGLIGAARTGHPAAARLVADAGRQLGIAVANLVNLVNPARVILGGRLTDAGHILLGPLVESLRARALWTSFEDVEVTVGELGDDAIAVGAATAILRRALHEPHAHLLPGPAHLQPRRGPRADAQPPA
jgi:predicted NBD/HSP70 family sugar kinase